MKASTRAVITGMTEGMGMVKKGAAEVSAPSRAESVAPEGDIIEGKSHMPVKYEV